MIVQHAGESALYSFAICIVYTKGNYVAGCKSAALAAVATLIYAKIRENFSLLDQTESLFVSCTIIYLVGEKCCLHKFVPSICMTLVPYAIFYQNKVEKIPLFGIIVI